ncbi:hypothetical protein V8E53_002648 [Lactarius tabidus]
MITLHSPVFFPYQHYNVPPPTPVLVDKNTGHTTVDNDIAESLQNNTTLAHGSDVSNTPSSASPEPELDHRSILLLTTRTSPWPTSVPELVPATDDEGSLNTGPCEDEDALDLPPGERAIQANIMTVDLLLQPPLPSVTHIAIAGPSQRELDVGHRGDLRLTPSMT